MSTGPSPQRNTQVQRIAMGSLFVALSTGLLMACASTPGIQSAKTGDLQELRRVLANSELKPGQVRRLAEETLAAEIRKSKDREDRSFIRSLRACASPLADALEERAQSKDGVAAEATLMLLESGNLKGNPSRFAESEDGAWRAIAARAQTHDGAIRRQYFSDPDERVRRNSLLAALEVSDSADVDALLEVSRVDPDPLCRNRAIQSLAKIGGDRVSDALIDRFENATEEVQLAIVDAWGSPKLYESRGRRRLARLTSHKDGYPALLAARRLAQDSNESIKNQGIARLVRFAEGGTPGERRMALRLMPGHEELTTTVLFKASQGEDQEVALIAWARLLQSPRYRPAALKRLSTWAESTDPLAYQARAAISTTGDKAILPLMRKQMTHEDPDTRQLAGRALLRLGAFSEAAPLLADEEASVRRTIACQIVAKPLEPRFNEEGR